MKKPWGITLEFGVGKGFLPQFCISPQRYGKLRPRVREQNPSNKYEDDVKVAEYGGIRLDIGVGTWRRPIAKFWKKEFWSKDNYIKNTETNAWNSGKHWFVLSCPVPLPYLFLSVMVGRWGKEKLMPGFYIGGRTAYVDQHCHQLATFNKLNGEVETWIKRDGEPVLAWGKSSEDGNIYVEPTLSIRSDFLH